MKNQLSEARVLLIGGSSHTGKSTLAKILCEKWKAKYIATDHLAKHPGRPWKEQYELIPSHVKAHYLELTVEELIADVTAHYRKVWLKVEEIITAHLTDANSGKLMIEGSAILPDLASKIIDKEITAIWLTANENTFMERIYASSQFVEKSLTEQSLINKFLERTIWFDAFVRKDVEKLKLKNIDVTEVKNLEVGVNKKVFLNMIQ